ncbi:MAG TPA: D-2-hydroxyacid dehydrogenase [Planctomycetaceae bacterium]|nr:D-2-hydroxyacid dehydrogenase [Planctomycetaceae bacterium]
MKLVVYPPLEQERWELVRRAAGTMHVVNAPDRESAEREIVDADGFFGKLTPELLAASTKLRWVQTPTASLEHYMFPALAAHPCQLTNMRGLFSDVIADHVMGFVLCFARNLHLYLRQQMRGHWEPIGGEQSRSDFITGPGVVSEMDRAHQHLSDCTLGVVGVGNIGAEIARRARCFNMRVIGIDPVQRSVPGVLDEIWDPARLPELLAACDYVVIAAPHTPETYKLFRTPQFEQMRRSAVLINIGRGAIVDLADLTAALETKLIAGAALDVFEIEPLPADHPLWRMENVLLTPHVAAASTHIAERHTATLLENVRRFAAGEPLVNVVNKELWF